MFHVNDFFWGGEGTVMPSSFYLGKGRDMIYIYVFT